MAKQRWMKSVLAESKKEQITPPWARQIRPKRAGQATAELKKAS